jgi:hypothetical protein
MPKTAQQQKVTKKQKISPLTKILFHPAPLFSGYSLNQNKNELESKLNTLNKKHNLTDILLNKTSEESKFEKQRFALLKKKDVYQKEQTNIQTMLVELDSILCITKGFWIYLKFFLKFFYLYQYSIISNEPKNIPREKIEELLHEENVLFNLMNTGGSFDQNLLTLNFSAYQPYLDAYVSKLFTIDPIAPFCDSFWVISKKIHHHISMLYRNILEDNFSLTAIKAFLDSNFFNCVFPNQDYFRIGFKIIASQQTLFELLKLRPVLSSYAKFENSRKLYRVFTLFNEKHRLVDSIFDFKIKFNKLERSTDKFFKNSANFTKTGLELALKFLDVTRLKITEVETPLNELAKINLNNVKKIKGILDGLSDANANNILSSVNKNISVYFPTLDEHDGFLIQKNKAILNSFFCFAYYKSTRSDLIKCLVEYFTIFSIDFSCSNPVALTDLKMEDFLELSHGSLFSLVYPRFYLDIAKLKEKLFYFKLCTLNIFFVDTLRELAKLKISIIKQYGFFFENDYKNPVTFSADKKNLAHDVNLGLTQTADAIKLINESKNSNMELFSQYIYKNSRVTIATTEFYRFFSETDVNLDELTDYLLQIKASFELKKRDIAKRNFNLKAADKIEKRIEKKQIPELKAFDSPIYCLSVNLIIVVDCIEKLEKNFQKKKVFFDLKVRFSSALGQLRAAMQLIKDLFTFSIVPSESTVPLNVIATLETLKKFLCNSFTESKAREKIICLLEKTIPNSLMRIDSVSQTVVARKEEFSALTKDIEAYLDQLMSTNATPDDLQLRHTKAENKKMQSPDFVPRTLQKKPNFLKNNNALRQQLFWLQELIRVIHHDPSSKLVEFYSVIAKIDEYEKAIKCLQMQAPAKRQAKKLQSKNNTRLLKSGTDFFDNVKKEISPKTKSYQISQETIAFGINCFNSWEAEFGRWKSKKDRELFNIFNTLEQCSSSILQRISGAFIKILNVYKREVHEKNEEIRQEKVKINRLLLKAKDKNPIYDYLFYNQTWVSNLLVQIQTYINFLMQHCDNNSIAQDAKPQLLQSFNRPPEFDNLLAKYLSTVLNYNKTKRQLLHEEKKLADLSRQFASKILQSDLAESVDQSINLVKDFNSQLRTVNRLEALMQQECATRSQIKSKLAAIADPNLLKFYISRIDPSDLLTIEGQYQLPIASSTIINPLSFRFTNAAPSHFDFETANFQPNLIYYGV